MEIFRVPEIDFFFVKWISVPNKMSASNSFDKEASSRHFTRLPEVIYCTWGGS